MNLFLFQVSTPMLSKNFFILSFFSHYNKALKCFIISSLLPVKYLLFHHRMCLSNIVTFGSLFLFVTARVLWVLWALGGRTTEDMSLPRHLPAPPGSSLAFCCAKLEILPASCGQESPVSPLFVPPTLQLILGCSCFFLCQSNRTGGCVH